MGESVVIKGKGEKMKSIHKCARCGAEFSNKRDCWWHMDFMCSAKAPTAKAPTAKAPTAVIIEGGKKVTFTPVAL